MNQKSDRKVTIAINQLHKTEGPEAPRFIPGQSNSMII